MTVTDADISNALLISTCNETYPESDEILTTDLTPPTLRASLQLIEEAKRQTEVGGSSQRLATFFLITVCADRYTKPQSK